MEELSDDLYDGIIVELEAGDDLSERLLFKAALSHYQRGLDKVPNPQTDWEVSLHLYTALGDCYQNLGEFELANDSYNSALQCPDGLSNGYVWLGLGQSYYRLNNMEKAKDALMSAFTLEGHEIFEEEDEVYYDLIKTDAERPIDSDEEANRSNKDDRPKHRFFD